jgi:hypothetical protein
VNIALKTPVEKNALPKLCLSIGAVNRRPLGQRFYRSIGGDVAIHISKKDECPIAFQQWGIRRYLLHL